MDGPCNSASHGDAAISRAMSLDTAHFRRLFRVVGDTTTGIKQLWLERSANSQRHNTNHVPWNLPEKAHLRLYPVAAGLLTLYQTLSCGGIYGYGGESHAWIIHHTATGITHA